MSYLDRRAVGDSYIPNSKQILASFFGCSAEQLQAATLLEDCQEATDLIAPGNIRIAVRNRTNAYKAKYYGQFTIRSSSSPNEYEKLEAGLADYIFYSFGDANEVTDYWLMKVCPATFKFLLGEEYGNDSQFYAFRINPAVVVASQSTPPTTN